MYPIVDWYLSSFKIGVPPEEFHEFFNQFVLDCPEHTVLMLQGDVHLILRKESEFFTCEWRKLDNRVLLPFAVRVEQDKCHLTRQAVQEALVKTFPEKVPTCMIMEDSAKQVQFWVEPEEDVEDFVESNLHLGHFYGFLSTKPSRTKKVVRDLYSLLPKIKTKILERAAKTGWAECKR